MEEVIEVWNNFERGLIRNCSGSLIENSNRGSTWSAKTMEAQFVTVIDVLSLVVLSGITMKHKLAKSVEIWLTCRLMINHKDNGRLEIQINF